MVGLGETDAEVEGLLADLASIGVDIVTIGQYLRPTSHHIPVDRWVEPERFTTWARIGESLGIGHVEASPLTRSSYHARSAAAASVSVSLLRTREAPRTARPLPPVGGVRLSRSGARRPSRCGTLGG